MQPWSGVWRTFYLQYRQCANPWCSVGTVLEDREAALELRVENLLDTLDRLTHNTELRQQQATELIEDLKRANW